MYTANDIKAMNNTTARKVAEGMAIELTGTERFKVDLAERVGVTRDAVNKWFSSTGRPPAIVILYMQAELARRDAQGKLDNLKSALDFL